LNDNHFFNEIKSNRPYKINKKHAPESREKSQIFESDDSLLNPNHSYSKSLNIQLTIPENEKKKVRNEKRASLIVLRNEESEMVSFTEENLIPNKIVSNKLVKNSATLKSANKQLFFLSTDNFLKAYDTSTKRIEKISLDTLKNHYLLKNIKLVQNKTICLNTENHFYFLTPNTSHFFSVEYKNKVVKHLENPYGVHDGGLLLYQSPDTVYLLGGFNTNMCEYYSTSNNHWKIISPLTKKRGHASASVVNHTYIFILFGGNMERVTLNTVERLDIRKASNKWEIFRVKNLTKTELQLVNHATIYHEKRIYIVGGYDGKNFSEGIYSMDIVSGCVKRENISIPEFSLNKCYCFSNEPVFSRNSSNGEEQFYCIDSNEKLHVFDIRKYIYEIY